jgi:hypothetical protein
VGTHTRLEDDEGKVSWPIHAASLFVGFDPPVPTAPTVMFGTYATVDGAVANDSLVGLENGQSLPFVANMSLMRAWESLVTSGRVVIRRGRPRGSGTFEDAETCRAVFRAGVQALRDKNRYPSQAALARHLSQQPGMPDCDARQVRRWLEDFDLTWPDILDSN